MADVASLAVGLALNDANFRSQLTAAFRTAGDQSGRYNRQAQQDAKKTEEAYQRVSGTIQSVTGRLIALTGAGLSLGSVIQTSRQYGQALSDLSAITGATGAQLQLFDDAAQQMGRTTEYSASQAAEALKLMASAKPELLQTSDGLVKATNSALILAQAAGTTLPDATKTLALSLNQFGASATSADRYINVLAAGAKYGSSEIVDTAAAIKNGGVAAAQAGIGFEQLNAAIQVLAEREIKGGEAGTGLRNVILNLEKGTDKTLKPSVVGLSTALENLSKKNLSTAQAVKLFGLENITAASILVQNRDKLGQLTTALTGTQTAHEQAAVRVNNLNGDLMGLTSAFEGLIIKVGQANGGPLRAGVQGITGAMNGLADNFNMVASVALYTLIPVLSTRLTAGVRESISAWRQQQIAVRSATLAQAEIAQKTLSAAEATLKQNDAEFGHYRAMERTAKQYGMNVSYQGDFNRLIREETEATRAATLAKAQLDAANRRLSFSARAASVASGLARGAFALIGGPFGAAMLAGSAILYFHDQAIQARQTALGLKDAVIETTASLLSLSQTKIAIKIDDYQDQLKTINDERAKLKTQLEQHSDTRIQTAKDRSKGMLGFLYADPAKLEKEKNTIKGQLEDLDTAANTAQQNLKTAQGAMSLTASGYGDMVTAVLNGVKNAQAGLEEESNVKSPWGGEDVEKPDKKLQQALKQYQDLRNDIEQAHASSLTRINLQEQESQAKLQKTAKAAGVGGAEVQRLMLLNAETFQRQRMELAEKYSPAQVTIRQEREGNKELKSLLDARLLSTRDYIAARKNLQMEMARDRLKADADAISAPKMNIAGDVDPVVQLQNQLAQQQAQYQAYYQQGYINKQQFELLMQNASQESADAQYQQSLSLYAGQSKLHKMQLALIDTVKERSTNMLTGWLTRTQTFKDGMIGLFSSLTQSIIQNLVDMAAQAIITSTIMRTITGIVGGIAGGVGGAASGAASSASNSFSSGAYSNLSFNAKGGVYDSPDLSSYSGQVVSNPTLFAFAKGAGVFGEAGPEAIMPLKRGPDGSLGVRASGPDGSASAMGNQTLIDVNITINADGSRDVETTTGYEQAGADTARFVDQRFAVLLDKSIAQGGKLNRFVKGAR